MCQRKATYVELFKRYGKAFPIKNIKVKGLINKKTF